MKEYVIWLLRNTKGIRVDMLFRIAAGIGRVSLGLLMVWLCKRFIDVTIRQGTTEDIILMIVALVAVVIGGIICRQSYYFLGVRDRAKQTTSIRLRIFSHLFRRQMFDQKEMHSGDVTSRLEKDIDVVSDATTSLFPDMTVTLIQLVGAFLLMQSMDTRLAWALLLLTPMFLIVGKLIGRKMRMMTLDIRKQESVIQMLVQETMEHNAVLRSLESGDWITNRLDDMQQNLRGKISRRARFTVISRLLIGSSFSLGYIMAFIWGAMQLRNGAITFGVMTSFLQLVSQIQNPILQMLNMVPQFIQASASIDRLTELEQVEVEETGFSGIPGSSEISRSSGSLHPLGVKVEDVSFKYADGDREILTHFSFDFKPGSKTALMGHTGAGKTTLFRLLLALTKPNKGTMAVYDSQGQQTISEQTRSNFVFVPQGNTLMSGTIRYNLLLARPDATDEELDDVLHTAMADFVLDLPDGLDTECGERGSGLSEGQAQRIAIARGLLRPGGILLLDEISASLDEATERELYRRLFAKYPGKTMIFITHRPVVCELCDQVIKLRS
ncbi:MAG: ABC transporter ATP-binding protein [Prevotella sp.]|nr:ABC transporter ATP-binding protein [Prevotella sp.]